MQKITNSQRIQYELRDDIQPIKKCAMIRIFDWNMIIRFDSIRAECLAMVNLDVN